ncbi:hypothetical protein D3C78_785000 [compost metagenome]
MQTRADLARATGKHGVQRAEQVTQVVGGGDQAGGGQADLAFSDQVRQLRGEGKAANTHGHHQGHGAGKQANGRGHAQAPERGSMTVRLKAIDFQ